MSSFATQLLLAGEYIPSNFLSAPDDDVRYALLVNKSSQKMSVYQINGTIKEIESYPVSIGENNGDKTRSGDKRTPEGIYFFEDVKDENLPNRYGPKAFVMNYPNPVDKIKGKTGYGIWLHGTNKKSLEEYKTKGCVATTNENLDRISKFINLNETPIIIADSVEMDSSTVIVQSRQKLMDYFNSWLKSWEQRDIEKYLSFYNNTFHSKQFTYRKFVRHKRKIFKLYEDISVSVDDLFIYKMRENYYIEFKQRFKSNLYEDYGLKKMFLVEDKGELKIVYEEWSEIIEKTLTQE